VLQTPVTFAPNDFAIWTANVPTPPDAPLINHPVSRLHLPLIANGVEGGERGVSDRRRLLEREVGRLRQEVVLCSARILSEGAFAPAEHLIARPKLFHVSADRLDLPGYIESRNLAPRLAQANPQTHDVWHPLQEMPGADIDCRCAHAYQHLIVLDDRLVDVLDLQDIR
jgi:hypothetical protein